MSSVYRTRYRDWQNWIRTETHSYMHFALYQAPLSSSEWYRMLPAGVMIWQSANFLFGSSQPRPLYLVMSRVLRLLFASRGSSVVETLTTATDKDHVGSRVAGQFKDIILVWQCTRNGVLKQGQSVKSFWPFVEPVIGPSWVMHHRSCCPVAYLLTYLLTYSIEQSPCCLLTYLLTYLLHWAESFLRS
jgi:hypothetical protein